MALVLSLLSLLQEPVTWTPGPRGQTCKLGLFCMQRMAPTTAHIENSIAGVFANFILREKFKQILLKVNPFKV